MVYLHRLAQIWVWVLLTVVVCVLPWKWGWIGQKALALGPHHLFSRAFRAIDSSIDAIVCLALVAVGAAILYEAVAGATLNGVVHSAVGLILVCELLFVYALIGATLGALAFWNKTWLVWTVGVLAVAGTVWSFRSGILRGEADWGTIIIMAEGFVGFLAGFKTHSWLSLRGLGSLGAAGLAIRRSTRPVALVTVIVAALAILDFWVWRQIKANTQSLERQGVQAVVDGESVAEVGYISEVRREIDWSKWRWKVTWVVTIPITGRVYSCGWEGGYPKFSEGDAVGLIHNKKPDITLTGFLVGLHGRERGRSALTEPVDVEAVYESLY